MLLIFVLGLNLKFKLMLVIFHLRKNLYSNRNIFDDLLGRKNDAGDCIYKPSQGQDPASRNTPGKLMEPINIS